MTISKSVTIRPFKLPPPAMRNCMGPGEIQSSPNYGTFHLTDHRGASIVVDLQASGSENAPEFHCRLRIDSLSQSTSATALRDLYSADKPPAIQDVYRLTVSQIKAKLMERGEIQAMRGKTKKEEFVNLLHASNERIHAASPGTLVAKAGQEGRVVKPLYTNDDGEGRIGVSFEPGHCLEVFPTSVKLGKTLYMTEEGEPIGKGSFFHVIGGSISFRKGFSGEEHEYFLSSTKVPAAPGVLVPWRKVFHVGGVRTPKREPLF